MVAALLPDRIYFRRATRASAGFNSFDASAATSTGARDAASGLEIGILPVEEHIFSPRRVAAHLRWSGPASAIAAQRWSGLADLGKTSYLNAVVQCLAHTPPLVDFLLGADDASTAAASNARADGSNLVARALRFNACDTLGALLREMRNAAAVHRRGAASVAPHGLVRALRNLNRDFSPGRPEDAFTFFRALRSSMQATCLRDAGLDEGETGGRAETTAVFNIFGGYLCADIVCSEQPAHARRTFAPHTEISLDLTAAVETGAKAKAAPGQQRARGVREMLKSAAAYEGEEFMLFYRYISCEPFSQFDSLLPLTYAGPR